MASSPTAVNVEFDPRPVWDAAPSKRPLARWSPASLEGVTLHHIDAPAVEPHAACRVQWRGVQRYHLEHPTQDYADIAYGLGACGHGVVLEGRGVEYSDADALGSGSCGSVAVLTRTTLTSGMRWAVLGALELYRAAGAGAEVRPHSLAGGGFTATACPGDEIREWIAAGLPAPFEGDDMTPTQATQLDELHARLCRFQPGTAHALDFAILSANGVLSDPEYLTRIAGAVVAKLPPAAAGGSIDVGELARLVAADLAERLRA